MELSGELSDADVAHLRQMERYAERVPVPAQDAGRALRPALRGHRLRRLRRLPRRDREGRRPADPGAEDRLVRGAGQAALRPRPRRRRPRGQEHAAGRAERPRRAQHLRAAQGPERRRDQGLHRAARRARLPAADARRLPGPRADRDRRGACSRARSTPPTSCCAGSPRRRRARSRAADAATRPWAGSSANRGKASTATCSTRCGRCASRSRAAAACRPTSSSTTARCARWPRPSRVAVGAAARARRRRPQGRGLRPAVPRRHRQPRRLSPFPHRLRTPAAFVPAAHVTPPGLVYIARSTTIWRGRGAEALDDRAEAPAGGGRESRPTTFTLCDGCAAAARTCGSRWCRPRSRA